MDEEMVRIAIVLKVLVWCPMWKSMPLIPVFGRLKEKDFEF